MPRFELRQIVNRFENWQSNQVFPVCVEVTCPDEVAASRIADRRAQGTNPRDADVAVRLSQKREFDHPNEFGTAYRIQLDGTVSAGENCSQIVSRLGLV